MRLVVVVADGFTWLVVVEVVVVVASVAILSCGYCGMCGSDLLVVWLM